MIRILLINSIISVMLFAQDTTSMNFGFKGGFNLSYISGNNENSGKLNEDHSKLGYNFGIILDKRYSAESAFQVELLYSNIGSKWGKPFFSLKAYDGNYVIYELQYISLSAYLKLKSKIGKLFKDFDFVIGASYSYNLKARQKWIVEYYDYDFDSGPSDIRNDINHHEIGLIGGVKFPFGNRKYYLNILFYHAISTLYKEKYKYYKDDFNTKENMRNNTFSISMDVFL